MGILQRKDVPICSPQLGPTSPPHTHTYTPDNTAGEIPDSSPGCCRKEVPGLKDPVGPFLASGSKSTTANSPDLGFGADASRTVLLHLLSQV